MIDRRELFGNLYYGFDIWWGKLFNNRDVRRAIRGASLTPDFEAEFKNTILPYWKKFGVRPKKYWFKYLNSLTGSTDPRYIPHTLFINDFIPFFDEYIYIRQLADKNLHSLMFPNMKRPETVYKRIGCHYSEDDFTPIPRETAVARLLEEGSYVIKPTRDSGQGTNVRFFTNFSSVEEAEKTLALYEKTDYIVQKAVKQHPVLAEFNASSLNTIRIVTVVLKDEPVVLSTILRIGGSGSKVDNVSKGGYQCTIRPDGSLEPLAYTNRSGKAEMVSENERGLRFGDCVIPSFDKAVAKAKELAVGLPHLKLIGWDLAIDENGEVVLIEFNSQISQNQATCGPTFGDRTEEVLSMFYHDRMKKKHLI